MIGSRGWLHKHWEGQFYPDDMPKDWRLSYYSNEFDVVLIDDVTLLAGGDEVEIWVDEVSDGFNFLIEITSLSNWYKCLESMALIKQNLSGIILSTMDATDSELKSIISAAAGLAPVSINQKLWACYTDVCEKDTNCGLFWEIDGALTCNICSGVSIAEVADTRPIGPPGLRKIIEQCLSKSKNAAASILIFGGTMPDVDTMRKAAMMKDLIE